MRPHRVALADGGIETSLLFHEGFDLPCFASFPLLGDERGRAALRRYFEPFFDIAQERQLPFVLDTATWRASPDWGAQLGYDRDGLAEVNRSAVRFARELAERRSNVTINGVIGPRGDGYVVAARMSSDEAAEYHAWQIGVLREAGVEQITALTLTYPEEATGVVQAAAVLGVPVIASFTVETNGRLPDGTSIAQAIEQVDRATSGAAEFFMINCAHPTHIAAGLNETPTLDRIGGLRANASALSHAELDQAEQLDEGDPVMLGHDNAALHEILPAVRLLGGCCGTDHRHVAEMIAAWDRVSSSPLSDDGQAIPRL
jgi:homocysteine S-methyltransferase